MSHQVVDPIADLRREPAHEAALDTQALFGERVTVYETKAGLAANSRPTAMSAICPPMHWRLRETRRRIA